MTRTGELAAKRPGLYGDGYLRNGCRGCHSRHLEELARHEAPEGVDFNTHDEEPAWIDRIRERATGLTPTRPAAGAPSVEHRERFRAWLDAGAP
ncbi:MAG: hypothetical protein B7733_11765 [Myxococcales bacterium FL481]|nr:MAG: hypothetical protein B7733_11765 [Myxococcales bacterium FL481]